MQINIIENNIKINNENKIDIADNNQQMQSTTKLFSLLFKVIEDNKITEAPWIN